MNKHISLGLHFSAIFSTWFPQIQRSMNVTGTLHYLLYKPKLKAFNVPPFLRWVSGAPSSMLSLITAKLGRAWLGCSWQSCAFCLEISHSIMLHEKLCFSPGDLLPLLCLLRPSVHLSIMPSWQRMDSFCPSETRSSCAAACAEANSVSSVGLIRCWCHFKRCLEQQLLVMIHALFHINIIQNI